MEKNKQTEGSLGLTALICHSDDTAKPHRMATQERQVRRKKRREGELIQICTGTFLKTQKIGLCSAHLKIKIQEDKKGPFN